MLYVYKLCKDNNITVMSISKLLNMTLKQTSSRLNNKINFSFNDLYILRDYFIERHIIKEDFDIGTFLDDVDN